MHSILLGLYLLGSVLPGVQRAGDDASPKWEAKGTLFECCNCSVPCPCNFGQNPTYEECNSLYAYRLKTAVWNGIKLDGLIFGGGQGPKGAYGFLDTRATPAQRAALHNLALAVFAKGGPVPGERKFAWIPVTATEDDHHFQVKFDQSGGFAADVLLGPDRKHPIIVENNVTWPVHRFIKGKTTRFDYKDPLGNRLQYQGRNANLGDFDLSSEPGDQP